MRTHTGWRPRRQRAAPRASPAIKDAPQADLPRLDAVDDSREQPVTPTLTADANTSAAQYAQPTLQLTTDATLTSPVLGSYAGDDVTVNLAAAAAAYTVTACSRSTPTPADEQVDRRDDPHPGTRPTSPTR